MTRMMLAQGDRPFGNRLDDLTKAFQKARASTIESRRYNHKYLSARANTTELRPGDHVVLKVGNREGLTSRWDPQWVVTRVNGPATYIYQLQTGLNKVVNRDKLLRVSPDIAWEEINPRPRRVVRNRPIRVPMLDPQDPMNEAPEGDLGGGDPDWLPPGGRPQMVPAPALQPAPDAPPPGDAPAPVVPPQPIAAREAEAGPAPPPAERPARPRHDIRPSARARENLDRRDIRDDDLQRMFIRKTPADRTPSPHHRKRLRTQEMIACIELVGIMCQ